MINTEHQPLKTPFLVSALLYNNAGFSTIPINSHKQPVLKTWKPYQSIQPTRTEITNWFSSPVFGMAIIAGKIAGNLELIDVDCKFDLTGDLWSDFKNLIIEHAPELYKRLVIAQTVNGGYHLLFRHQGQTVEGNHGLASRPTTDAEKEAERKIKGSSSKCHPLIETRGEGGYFAVSPTTGYKFIQGDLSSVPTISDDERFLIYTLARSFDQMPVEVDYKEKRVKQGFPSNGLSPFEDFNQRADVVGLLENEGWRVVSDRGNLIQLKRPGATDSKQSATYFKDKKVFYVFSTSTEFDSEKGYSPSGVYTHLKHNGDYSAAAKQLYADGYGERFEAKAQQKAASEDFQRTSPKVLPKTKIVTPTLNPALIPEPWREWLTDVSERLQCPLDFASVSALVSAATIIGNRICMRPKVNDSWLVVPNLWGAIVASPGALKSPAAREGKLFLEELANRERSNYEASLKDAEFEKEYNEAKKNELKKNSTKNGYSKEEYKEKFDALQVDAPTEKRLFTSDSTVEKLGELLNENPHGIGNFRDELTGWLKMLDRSGHEQDRAFYLECWNGDGSFTFDRIGRGTTHIKNLTVSIFGTIQPSMIETYLRGSIEGGSDDGLIQRFQILVYPDAPKTYKYIDAQPKGRDEAREIFHRLYDLNPDLVGAKFLTKEAGGRAFLQFDDEAQVFFQEWLTELEINLRSDTFATSALESHLAKYRSLMPTLSLIFHLIDYVSTDGKGKQNAVGLTSAQMAAAWCSYLQKHAEKLYNSVLMSDFDVAAEILKRINSKQIAETFTARDIYGNHWKDLSTPESVKAGLGVLVEYGYLFQTVIETGGRAKVEYTIHDSLR